MRKRIAMILGAATVVSAGCQLLGGETRAEQVAKGSDGVPVYPLPGIKLAGERRKLDSSFKTLHTFAVCSQQKCTLNVYVEKDCSAPDLDPQGLGLDHRIDEFELTYNLYVPQGTNFVLGGIREKTNHPGDPQDIFAKQSGAGTPTIKTTVKNHFKKDRQYVIEIGPPGKPCVVLDPPIMPDY
jgi:hypothetical protein